MAHVEGYASFLEGKRLVAPTAGVEVAAGDIHPMLFPFQRDVTRWALRKGRAALLLDTGMGKTFCQLEWSRLLGMRTLIVAPLSVARQTVAEARKIGLDLRYTRSGADLSDGLNITNYEMLEHFDASAFGAVVLDESSILKGLDGKTRKKLTEMFAATPYRLCCTATPAPNDIAEIANHAEFLGVMTRVEMLAAFFIHDDEGWRLKGHASESFYRWLASWGMSVKKPSDLGYSDEGYELPPIGFYPVWVQSDYVPKGQLFATGLHGIQDRIQVRKGTLRGRVEAAAEIVNHGTPDQWIVWCGLNDEGRELHRLIPGSVLVEGSQSPEEKAATIEAFQDGKHRVLISKSRIAGFGMNFQNCHRMAFVGLSDSWEQYYQSVRRCWRFGQREPVQVVIVLSDAEREIYENVLRKDADAQEMSQRLIEHVREFEREEIGTVGQSVTYQTDTATGGGWKLMLGDSVERLAEVPDGSVGLSVFSPPFLSLYTYSPSDRDLGNSRTEAEFMRHFRYIVDHLLRVTMPGRLAAVHCADVAAMLVRDGYIGLKDFPGMTVRLFEGRGWIYHGRVTIDKNPQVQALRTHSKGLVFGQTEKDSSWSRPGMADYILLFRKPGNNPVPIKPDMTRQEWILWARPVWYAADYLPGTWEDGGDGASRKSGEPAGELGIREADTLNVVEGRSQEDERHIAPLQKGVIERCVRLWSNRGETVLSPFAGIGSEGYVSLLHGRRFVGCELKPEYYRVAVKNLERAETLAKAVDMFTYAGISLGEDNT